MFKRLVVALSVSLLAALGVVPAASAGAATGEGRTGRVVHRVPAPPPVDGDGHAGTLRIDWD